MNNYVLVIATIAFLLVGCAKNEGTDNPVTGDPATMTISLKGDQSGVLKSTGKPSQAGENTINNLTIYVFNGNNNLLEKIAKITPANKNDTIHTITGLVTGLKKVVVVANEPTYVNAATDSSYSDIAARRLDLGTQTDSTNLTMSGEGSITLAASPATNELRVPVRRVVAKIELGTVTLANPLDPGHNAGLFTLDSVYVMKAIGEASAGISSLTTGGDFYGGIKATVSQVAKLYLRDKRVLAAADNNDRYFYVFPNDNSTGNATLITLVGTYNGVRTYFPFRVGTGTLSRNTYYTVNVTIKRPGSGSSDPETLVDPATLEVTVIPVDWILAPIQNVEW